MVKKIFLTFLFSVYSVYSALGVLLLVTTQTTTNIDIPMVSFLRIHTTKYDQASCHLSYVKKPHATGYGTLSTALQQTSSHVTITDL